MSEQKSPEEIANAIMDRSFLDFGRAEHDAMRCEIIDAINSYAREFAAMELEEEAKVIANVVCQCPERLRKRANELRSEAT